MIYLDYNATTPVAPEVLKAMLPYLSQHYGNPSSVHALGEKTKSAIAAARRAVAQSLDAEGAKIIFTATGSEGNNLALKGIAHALRYKGKHIIISAVEHPAISLPAAYLEKEGYDISVIPVDGQGRINPADVTAALRDDTILISVMLANNETGTVQPVKGIATIAHQNGILMHTDAAQAIGKMRVSFQELGVDLMTIVGHKIYAPKGIGALIVKEGVNLEPLIHGASHEYGLRAGTENVPYIVALGKACELAVDTALAKAGGITALTEKLHNAIKDAYPDAVYNGHVTEKLCNTLNISFPGLDMGRLIEGLQSKIACSTGAACHSGDAAPSSVLLQMGKSTEVASTAIRFSLGLYTSEKEIEEAIDHIKTCLGALQNNKNMEEKASTKEHWENIYTTKSLESVSWYQPVPETSLEMITKYAASKDAAIIDMGGGDSFLSDHLLNLGYTDITVLDISEAAIARAKERLGEKADKVKWIVSDAANFLPERKYDIWHDRAAFHFLTAGGDISNYTRSALSGIAPDGMLILGTFSENGPKKCSGIDIRQYSEKSMKAMFQDGFEPIECFASDHRTPFDTVQNFTFCVFRKH